MPTKRSIWGQAAIARVLALFLVAGATIFFATSGASGNVLFHSGGVGYCEGCHVMHPGGPGEPPDPSGYYIRGSDPSSTCLNCHAQKGQPYQILSTDGSVFSPGGDFFWLTESGSVTIVNPDGTKTTSAYNSFNKGHSIVAADFGLTNNPLMEVPPGNTSCGTNQPGYYVTSDYFSCINCHDPHGRYPSSSGIGTLLTPIRQSGSYGQASQPGYGKYRLLNRVDFDFSPDGIGRSGAIAWLYNDPIAVADSSYNYNFSETADNRHHVDYGSGMSEWCSNCHCDFLNSGNTSNSSAHRHPAGAQALMTKVATSYNSYVGTGDFSGAQASSWLSLVPFERGVTNPALLNGERTDGPFTGKENVMCLTCHRAHASAFDHDTRWDTYTTFLNASSPGPVYNVGQNLTKPFIANAPYYGRDINAVFGPNQRSLCNKCHAQD